MNRNEQLREQRARRQQSFDERGMASDMENIGEEFSNYYPHQVEHEGQYYGIDRRGKHYGKGPKGWRRTDERIQEDASEALYKDWHVDASHIEVSVKDACIYLRGSVGTREDKKRAERCVEHLSGVEDVHNELKIKRESEPQGFAN